MSPRVAIVTGANSGIGLAIVRTLCKQLGSNDVVYLTARNEGRGQEAVELLKKEGLAITPSFHLLDVDDKSSIEKLRDDIKSTHGGLDILVNNAGIAYKGNDIPMSVQAEGSIKTNFFGVLNVTNIMLPLVRSGGRIVHVASTVAPMTYNKMSEELKKRFKEVSTEQGVIDLMNEFVEATKAGDHVEKGWVDWAYGTSKLGLVALTRVQGQEIAKDTSRQDLLINCCCPGYIMSGMTAHHKDPGGKRKTPEEGADTPVYLSLLPPGTTDIQGQFLAKRKILDFFNNYINPSF